MPIHVPSPVFFRVFFADSFILSFRNRLPCSKPKMTMIREPETAMTRAQTTLKFVLGKFFQLYFFI
jgi:hypothetical protein